MAKQHFENLEKTLTLSKNQIHLINTTHSYESLIIVLPQVLVLHIKTINIKFNNDIIIISKLRNS